MNKRTLWIVVGAAVAALLIVGGILLGVLLAQGSSSTPPSDDRHKSIVGICERQYEDPYGDDLDAFTRCVDELEASDRP